LALVKNSPPVLLFPTHYLGNFVLGLPWICSVLREHPAALVVIDSRFELLARAVLPSETELLLYPRTRLASSEPFFSRLRYYLGFLKVLRRDRDATLIDLEGERFTGVLSRLSGCRRRIGPAGKRAGRFYTDILRLDYYRHRFNAFGTVLADFVASEVTPDSHLPYSFTAEVKQQIDAQLKDVRSRRLIAIHPGASVAYKLWPQASFVELVSKLEQAGYQIVWVGAGESDAGIIDEVMQALPDSGAINLCDHLGFLELAALYRQCSCFVGSDSGPMHLAASTGIPVLALFGPSVEAIWSPLGDNSHVLRGTECCGEDCDAWHCDYSYRCLKSLSPEQVLEAVERYADNVQGAMVGTSASD